ncbi:hypothetical protein O181_106609 [Austropuccinia psidii MF-1]|uniref:Uncharacterized protein n=1 Tax=Austropuccinia psidii MF-1 TaxID=1389203 RepID=A0A9Q3JRP0_9BASI|nr:hypothetical protein [Austropuccinia psidii MF-1]
MSRRCTATGSLATHTHGTTTAVAITRQEVNLAGSTGVASDYFHYAINCVLYQHEIYNQAVFKMDKTSSLQMMIVEDEAIAEALQKIFDHVCDMNWPFANSSISTFKEVNSIYHSSSPSENLKVNFDHDFLLSK